ncbi:hypothetical protein HDU76_010462 [Blyttiomyces sp. JEL0837]|nr:hypothetical protein HDU76_010462 [Blyttiomyces sp. JEL0837]
MTTNEVKCFSCFGKGEALVPNKYTPRPLGEKDVEITISHCGICGSDIHTLDSGWGPSNYTPGLTVGHEIVGTVSAVGAAVTQHKIGDRVGVGAQVWGCLECNTCSKGHNNFCSRGVFTYNAKYEDGADAHGGYASHVRVQEDWAFTLPENLSNEVAAPLLCAGVTVFAPLRRYVTKPGMKVGVAGIGGLGHLALQFANALKAEVVAISHSPNKKEEAATLGATDFVVLENEEDYKRTVGTIDVLIVTSFHAHESLDKIMSLVAPWGQAVMLAIPEAPLQVHAFSLIMGSKGLVGSLIGSTSEVKDMLSFAAEHNVKPWIQVHPMEQVNDAIALVRAGKPRYRVVLEVSDKTFA